MSYWVHVRRDLRTDPHDPRARLEAGDFEPPVPPPVPGRGWARYFVEVEDCTLEFASLAELTECVRVLSLKPLPTSRQLSGERSGGAGPNSHWLSRLPSHIKSGTRSERVVQYLKLSLDHFRKERQLEE